MVNFATIVLLLTSSLLILADPVGKTLGGSSEWRNHLLEFVGRCWSVPGILSRYLLPSLAILFPLSHSRNSHPTPCWKFEFCVCWNSAMQSLMQVKRCDASGRRPRRSTAVVALTLFLRIFGRSIIYALHDRLVLGHLSSTSICICLRSTWETFFYLWKEGKCPR